MSVANIPIKLKPLASYLKTANEIEKRDPVVAYYCRLYSVQKGMELDRSSPESKKFLMELMDNLDKTKKELKDNESIISETVGQAHVEDYALRLFSFADKKDREGDFEPATIRSFTISGFLMDVLSVFGDVGEDVEKCRKYAKWKAVYISQCLKKGEIPQSGPMENEQDISGVNLPGVPPPTTNTIQPLNPTPLPRIQKPASGTSAPKPAASTPNPANSGVANNPANSSHYPESTPSNNHLSPEDFTQAEKLCKYASSALQYQDSATAIDYLTKCLDLLVSGKKS